MENFAEAERRQLLANFLRTRRARLTPGDVGLPQGLRRRTTGLRREEVAQLANIGVAWYTALEQSRDVRPSEQVVASLARALQLTTDERHHLLTLTTPETVVRPLAVSAEPNTTLCRLVEMLDPHPAYIIGRRWDILHWNIAAELVFSFSSIQPPHTRNLVWRAFTYQQLRQGNHDWERIARGMVAQLRLASVRYLGDPTFGQLINDLCHISPEFTEWWEAHDVLQVTNCHKEMWHPQLGYLEFEQATLADTSNPELQVVVYTAERGTTHVLSEALKHK